MTNDASVVEVKPVSGLQKLIDKFNAQFDPPAVLRAFAATNSTLRRIFIPGFISPVYTPGAEVGVNRGMVNTVRGLQVFVQPYANMLAGDLIEAFMGDTRIPAARVTVLEGQVGENIEVFIPANKVLAGVRDLYYVLTRAGATNKETSLVLKVLVRLLLPGGNDPQPDRPGHYNLLPPFLTKPPKDGVIGEEDLLDPVEGEPYGVDVTVPAYPNMRMYDTLHLSWGGSIVEYVVQPGEEGTDIVINVDSDRVYEAGDSDKLVLVYWVWDEVLNAATDWSLRGYVEVSIDPNKLQSPVILNPDPEALEGAPIDLALLGQDDVQVQVMALKAFGFKLRDVVTLTWVGTTAQGQVIKVESSQTVTSFKSLTFTIPNKDVQPLARGFARAWYTVRTPATGAQLVSRRAGVDLIGNDVKLPRPLVNEADSGILASTLASATVVVPAAAQLLEGDFIEITWSGTRSDGSSLIYTDAKTVTRNTAGKDLVFTVDGPVNIKPLSGGTLEVSYKVTREGLGRPLVSQALALQVGEAQLELPAPYCPQAANGELDPNTQGDVDVEIEPYDGMKVGQTIKARWCDAQNGCIYDEIPVTSRNVGKKVVFQIAHGDWSSHLTSTAEVDYQVTEAGKPTRVSAPLTLRLAEQQQRLPDPIVVGATNGTLRPDGDATVKIPAAAKLKQGDELELVWDGDGANGSTLVTRYILADQAGDLDILIEAKYVLANVEANVRVKYVVYRYDGREQTSGVVTLRIQRALLPAPVFVEATAGQQLNPDDVLNGATFRIDAVAHLRRGDQVTVTVQSTVAAGNFTRTLLVAVGDEEKALSVTVPYAAVNASNRTTVTLKYSIQRAAGGPVENSPVNTYFINRVIGSGLLRICGARYGASTYRASSTSRVLSAFNAQTLQPILSEWRYLGDTPWTAGTTWMDKQPWRPLRVRTQTDEVQLNPANIIGNGNDATVNGSAAFVALRDERGAGIRDMVGWGSAAHGANIPPTLITFDDIAEISCTRSAYAARRANGFVVCWGNAAEGGTMRANETGNFIEVRSNSVAFVGRKSDGRLSGWGSLPNGADIPPAIVGQAGYTAVYGAGTAFAAQKANGQLVAWGNAANGGTLPVDIATLTDILYVKGNFAAFAARRTNKRIVAWGNAGYGGAVPAAIAALTDVETLEGATAQAFSALRSTGQVVAWGAASHGGTVPAEITGLTDIVEVTSTWHAFCARRRNGRIVAWGNPTNGGTVPTAIAQLFDIVQVTGSAWAFAALRSNGTVVAWGRAEAGGDTTAVAGQLTNVRAVYANSNGFTALTSDGRVVTWGQPAGGGDSSSVQPALRGLVTTGHRVIGANATAGADQEWLREMRGD